MSWQLSAQDIIVKINGDQIKSKVLEIGDSSIRYKKFENIEGPTYSIMIKNISEIIYNNGTKDVFEQNTVILNNNQGDKPENNNINANEQNIFAGDNNLALQKALNRADVAKEIAKQTNAKEDWQDVINEYENALKINPAYALIYYNLGYANEVIEDFANATKYYKLFLKLEPNSSIAQQIQTNIDKLEYKNDKEKKQVSEKASINGIWVSDLKKHGRPYWAFTIDQFDNDIRVSVSPKSLYYDRTFTYPTAIALKERSKLHFMYSTDVTVNPGEALRNSANVISALDGVTNVVSSLSSISGAAGAVGSVVGAISSFAKAKRKNSTYLFSVDIADTNKLLCKYNIKKYVAKENKPTKTVYDSIKSVTFIKTTQNDLDAIKVKYMRKRSVAGALFLSFLPGGGQFYNKQYLKGALVYALDAILIGIALTRTEERGGYYYSGDYYPPSVVHGAESSSGFLTLVIGPTLVCAASIIDAAISARHINKKYFACNNTSRYNNICFKIRPNVTPIYSTSKLSYASGIGLSMNF